MCGGPRGPPHIGNLYSAALLRGAWRERLRGVKKS